MLTTHVSSQTLTLYRGVKGTELDEAKEGKIKKNRPDKLNRQWGNDVKYFTDVPRYAENFGRVVAYTFKGKLLGPCYTDQLLGSYISILSDWHSAAGIPATVGSICDGVYGAEGGNNIGTTYGIFDLSTLTVHPIPSEARVARRYFEAKSNNWTIPFLKKLIQVGEKLDYSGAVPVLQGILRSQRFGNIEPYPVDELWEYLEQRGVWEDEINLFKDIRPPQAPRARPTPSFYDAYLEFEKVSGKHLVLKGIDIDTNPELTASLKALTRAVAGLPKYRHAYDIWKSEVKKVILRGKPSGTEDASWHGPNMVVVLSKNADRVGTYRGRIIHELGHALEEKLGLMVTPWDDTPYGQPPYVSSYADTNATEDFAETFAYLLTEPAHLRRMAPKKYTDMKGRL